MPTGIVRSFNIKGGFGFICPDDGGKNLFVHSAALKRAGLKTLQDKQRLSYEVRNELNGTRSAIQLKIV